MRKYYGTIITTAKKLVIKVIFIHIMEIISLVAVNVKIYKILEI